MNPVVSISKLLSIRCHSFNSNGTPPIIIRYGTERAKIEIIKFTISENSAQSIYCLLVHRIISKGLLSLKAFGGLKGKSHISYCIEYSRESTPHNSSQFQLLKTQYIFYFVCLNPSKIQEILNYYYKSNNFLQTVLYS